MTYLHIAVIMETITVFMILGNYYALKSELDEMYKDIEKIKKRTRMLKVGKNGTN